MDFNGQPGVISEYQMTIKEEIEIKHEPVTLPYEMFTGVLKDASPCSAPTSHWFKIKDKPDIRQDPSSSEYKTIGHEVILQAKEEPMSDDEDSLCVDPLADSLLILTGTSMDEMHLRLSTSGAQRGEKRKANTEGESSKLRKNSRNEKYLLSDLSDEDIFTCLLELEREEEMFPPMYGLEDESCGRSSMANSELAKAMTDALSAILNPDEIPFHEENVELPESLGFTPALSPSASPSSTPTPALSEISSAFPFSTPTPARSPPSQAIPSSSATLGPVNWNVDAPLGAPNFQFKGSPGLKIIPEGNTPADYFSLFFTDDFFQSLVRETNRFAVILLTEKGRAAPRSLISDWKDVTVEEMKQYLALVFHSGIIRISRWSEYWSSGELFRIPIFASTMGRDRFLAILAALHFAENSDPDNPLPTDLSPVYKVLPLIEHFHDRMKNVHEAGKTLCIDESVVPWHGRLRFRQYKPGKSHKYGIKLYMLTEPDGLVHRFIIYAGAEDREVAGPGHARKVVHKLISGFEGSGRSLFMDNFYNSVDLIRDLLGKQIQTTGILRANRKNNPVDVIQRKLKKSEMFQRWSDEKINVAKSHDRRDVLTISSEFSGDLVTTSNRRGKQFEKPEVVLKYNEIMGGIGRCDQLLSHYVATRKSVRWYKKLGLHIMEILLLNSFIIFHRFSGDATDMYGFRKAVIKFLIGPRPQPQPSPRLSRGETEWFINPVHFPKYLECSSTAKASTRKMMKRCRHCTRRKITKKVTTFCPGCTDRPGLCLECFVPWHLEERNFKTTL